MKSRHTQIIAILATIIVVGGVALTPHEAHAWSFLPNTESIVDSVLTFLFNNILLPIANMFVQLTGYLLNTTMSVTLNMNSFVSASGGIVDSTWSVIRDISSILIIFFLLYTSILIIIQQTESKVQELIVMVVVAGILINFSLFFTKIFIDASNLVSLAFYRAITPSGAVTSFNNGGYLSSAINDGGLSNVFMNALELQKSYALATTSSGTQVSTNPIAVIAAGAGGVMLMWFAGLSFLAASILFAIRIGLLILLMAFSPVYFLGMIFPGKIKTEVSDLWKNTLIGQCLIMPIYMLFMYVALRVITNPAFKSILSPSNVAANASGSTGLGGLPTLIVSPGTIGTVMQYLIAILLIWIPLIAALKYAGASAGWTQAAVGKIKGWSKTALNKGWQNTGGRAASKIATSERFRDFAGNSALGQIALKGTRNIAKDYNTQLDKQVKNRTEFAESLGYNQGAMNLAQARIRRTNQALARAKIDEARIRTTPGSTAAAMAAAKANITRLEGRLGTEKQAATTVENKRKQDYANRINSGSIETLGIKVARKDKIGFSKIQIPILEKELQRHKDSLKETTDDIKQLQKAIANNPVGPGGVTGPTTAQQTEMATFLADQKKYTGRLNKVQRQIDNLKLIQ